jgi:hypothetical protein
MNDDAAELPELYRVIRVGLPEAPVPELADVEAWRAREKYPELRTRMPWFAVAEQEPDGRWRVLSVDDFEPQNCRDHLAHVCRLRAKDAEEAGDRDAVRAWETGYLRMESRKVDDLAVLDTRFRIIRGDFFFRVGPTGPEPPRPTDPDPAPIGAGRSAAHGAQGFLLDPTAATGISEALLKLDFMHSSYPQSAPPDVRADSMKAVYTHPGGVLLPAAFGIFEETATHWASQPLSYETPQAARDSLASGFAAMLPASSRNVTRWVCCTSTPLRRRFETARHCANKGPHPATASQARSRSSLAPQGNLRGQIPRQPSAAFHACRFAAGAFFTPCPMRREDISVSIKQRTFLNQCDTRFRIL